MELELTCQGLWIDPVDESCSLACLPQEWCSSLISNEINIISPGITTGLCFPGMDWQTTIILHIPEEPGKI